ncbi:hypothetical protein ACTA71_009379 [Dictyostelium dimigraforme]
MKLKYICIYLLFVYKFLFVDSECSFLKNETGSSVTELMCEEQIQNVYLFNQGKADVNLGNARNGVYYFDIHKYQFKNLLCDLSPSTIIVPEISSFPTMPTIGGNFNFTYNFPCYSLLAKIKFISIKEITIIPKYDPNLGQFNASIGPGCGILNFMFQSISLVNYFNASYAVGAISGKPILEEGNFTIYGSNLYQTTIKIYSSVPIENSSPISAPDPTTHSNIIFSIPESKYQGEWNISVSICGEFYDFYYYSFSPIINKMEGTLNDNGGNMTFTGKYLRPKSTITGSFGGKIITCFPTGSSKSVICTLPARKDSGSTGYDIPLTVTIDGKFTTSPFKISYDLPLIQSVSQFGNSQNFSVSGVYFSGVNNINVITGNKTKLFPKNEKPSDPGFFIQDNNTILAFLPNNTQPGYMSLSIGDAISGIESPRYNFKITPTITTGQIFNSISTSGGDLTIKGIFMRTVDSDGRDVPISASGDGVACGQLKDGDGLSFTCTLRPGFGSNHSINVYYDINIPIGSFVVGFGAPSITQSQQNNDGTIRISGKNLGDFIQNSIITVINSDGSRVNGTVVQSNHDVLTFEYPVGGQKNASYLFQLGDLKSNVYKAAILKPVIENTGASVPCGGGMVTINGHYFFNYTKDTTTIKIGKVPCNITSINVTTIECEIQPNLKSLSPFYTSGNKQLLITSSNPGAESMAAQYNYSFAPPTITNTSAIDQNALITIFGTSFGDADTEILIDGEPCTQPEINTHTYSSLTCNVTNYDQMLKYNYSDTKFNISISVDGQYFIAEIFQFKYESTISYGETDTTGFPNEMYIGIVAVVIFLALIYFTVKTQVENYIEERRARKAFRSIDNLRLQIRQKHAAEIAKVYSFGNQKAPKPDKSYFYNLRKKLSRLPLVKRCFKEHTD